MGEGEGRGYETVGDYGVECMIGVDGFAFGSLVWQSRRGIDRWLCLYCMLGVPCAIAENHAFLTNIQAQ